MRYFTFVLIGLILFSANVFAEDALFCPHGTGDTPPELVFEDGSAEDSTTEDFPSQILNYLNTTGSSEGLQEAIANSYNEEMYILWLKSNLVEADFTGNTIPDLLVEYTVSYGGGFNSQFSLYGCNEDHFVLLDNWSTGGWMNGEDKSPTSIEFAVDLNNNQRSDIVIRKDSIEGMKYHQSIYILEWNGSELNPIFQIGPSYGAYGAVELVNLDKNPATLELNIGYHYAYEEETAMAFIEYSYVRPIMMSYQWNGEYFAFSCEYFSDQPKQRLAILHSAETLRACGYYRWANDYYKQLWNTWDDTLLNWGGEPNIEMSEYTSELSEDEQPESINIETTYYRAFAGYRLVQLNLLFDEPWNTEDYVYSLQEDYQKGQHGYSYAAMAVAYWENYQDTGDLEQACLAAEAAFNLANETGDNPHIEYYEETYSNGETYQFGFYFANGRHYGANPDNVFAVPTDIDGMVSTPICL